MKIVALVQDKVQEEIKSSEVRDEEISQMVTGKRELKMIRDFQFGVLLTMMEKYNVDDVNAMTTMTVIKPRPEVASKKNEYYSTTSFDRPLKMTVPVEASPMIESTLTQSVSAKPAIASTDWDRIAAQMIGWNEAYWTEVAFAPSQYDVADFVNHTHIGSGMLYYRNSYASTAPGIEPAKWPDDEGYSLKA